MNGKIICNSHACNNATKGQTFGGSELRFIQSTQQFTNVLVNLVVAIAKCLVHKQNYSENKYSIKILRLIAIRRGGDPKKIKLLTISRVEKKKFMAKST